MFYSAAHDTSRVRSAEHIAAGVRTRRRHRFDFVSRACGTVFAVGVAPCWSSRVRVQIQRRKCWRIRGPLTRTDYNWMHRHIVVRYGYSCPVRAVHGHSHRAGCEAHSRRVLAPSPHSNNTSGSLWVAAVRHRIPLVAHMQKWQCCLRLSHKEIGWHNMVILLQDRRIVGVIVHSGCCMCGQGIRVIESRRAKADRGSCG